MDYILILMLLMSYSFDQYICSVVLVTAINSSSPGQNGCHFADDMFRCILMNEKFCISIKISLKFVPKVPIDNNPALG